MTVRIVRESGNFTIVVGRWACRCSWAKGRFVNGSRWCSGWHDWTEDVDP